MTRELMVRGPCESESESIFVSKTGFSDLLTLLEKL
jgi:hypothetical protein